MQRTTVYIVLCMVMPWAVVQLCGHGKGKSLNSESDACGYIMAQSMTCSLTC